jgi:hypothetical protein
MLTDLLDGTLPNLQDILLIQSSILEARDIYQPWRLGKQLLETKELEVWGCSEGRARGAWAGWRRVRAPVGWCQPTMLGCQLSRCPRRVVSHARAHTHTHTHTQPQDQVGMCLVHLLGDTETLQQNREQPEPVTLQQLSQRKKRLEDVRCGGVFGRAQA